MSGSHQTVNYEPLREGNDDAFDAAMLEAIAFVDDTNMEEDDGYENDDFLVAGKRDANEATATQGALSMSIAAIRQRKSRDTKKQLLQSWYDRIEDLEAHLAYLKRTSGAAQRISDHQAAIQAAQAHIIKTQRLNKRPNKIFRGRKQVRSFLQDWSASQSPQKGRSSPLETMLLPDDKGRRSGSL
ncbi:hypothetical protein AC1031_016786 [Aphanomyces cochlioides]|nr:hypothetical protein AC1031_016786 [Aphanomyces cochlioides]